MGRIFSSLRLQPHPLHQPLVLGLQLHQGLCRPQRRDDRTRFAPAEGLEILHPQLERLTPHASQQGCDFVRDHVVDVADEAQRHMIVLGVDPARAGQSAAQNRERLPDVGGNFETGKKARHDTIGMLESAYRAARGDSHLPMAFT